MASADDPPSVNAVAEDSATPYSTEFITKFCRQNWSQWVVQTRLALNRTQEEMFEQPTRQLGDTLYGLEQLLYPLAKVSGTNFSRCKIRKPTKFTNYQSLLGRG